MERAETLADWAETRPRPAVACAITKVVGSAPQGPGARIWVTRNAFSGTLGGGELERRVLERARELLERPDARPLVEEYVLCKEMGQCCGGRVEVFFEPVRAAKTAVLFGGGHVGRATAQTLSGTGLDVLVVDARAEWSGRDGLPEGVRVLREDCVAFARARAWTSDDACCIFTHSHDLDFELVRALLPRPVGYLGLIGSEHKADVFRARLSGLPGGGRLTELWDERMRCPIGVSLQGKNPKVIAVSIAAELLKEWGLCPRKPEAAAA